MGLHVALDHQAHGEEDHELSLAELVRAALHGHHHDVTRTPDHEHQAVASEIASASRLSTRLSAALPLATLVEKQPEIHRPPWRQPGPPDPVFTKTCSLLI